MSRNACNGETGEKSPASSDLNWMPKVAPWRLAILAKCLFTFWRLSANSAIFAKYAIFAKIATFQRAPLPSHLYFCLQFGDFGD